MPKRKSRADRADDRDQRQNCSPDCQDYVMLSAFDDPEKLVEVKLSLLQEADCRLAKMITHQAPCTRKGVSFWRSSMTKAMLTTFVRSLLAGELVLTKGVTVGEALVTFEFEGVMLKSNRHCMTRPRAGIAFSKPEGSVSEFVTALAARVSDALLNWPRLETVLDSVIGRNDEVNYSKVAASNISATPTRVWVRFAGRPKTPDANGADFALTLAQKPPRWLSEAVASLGVVHYALSQADPAFKAQRDEAAFKRLFREVDDGPLGSFYGVLNDFVRSCVSAENRQVLKKGERFFAECRATLLNNSTADGEPSLSLQYSRAVFTMVENTLHLSPDCSRIFSSVCADEAGQTPERSELKRALKVRGVQVVRWADERDPNVRPLVFPPSWRESGTACFGPAVLLDLQQLK